MDLMQRSHLFPSGSNLNPHARLYNSESSILRQKYGIYYSVYYALPQKKKLYYSYTIKEFMIYFSLVSVFGAL